MTFGRRLYGIATFAISIPLFPLLLLKKRSRERVLERYGIWNLSLPECAWFHGSSMGEINGLLPVIRKFKEKYPELPVLVTATSATGAEKALSVTPHVRLLPFDSKVWLRQALKKVSPRVFVFAETELWPELVDLLHERRVPMYLVNSRISDRSWPNYQRMKGYIAPLLKKLSAVLVSSRQSADRFIQLGADSSLVEVLGNAKYDVKPALSSSEEAMRLKSRFFKEDLPVLVLGSLRPGEDAVWFPAIRKCFRQGMKFGVVIAPRHLEKVGFFSNELNSAGLEFSLWAEIKQGARGPVDGEHPVVMLDTMGELNSVYGMADLAFVGATLVNIGGHNPLEPAAYGACVLVGPYCQNVSDVLAAMKENDAFVMVASQSDAEDVAAKMANRDASLRQIGERGRAVWQSYTGASEKILERIKF